MNKTKVFLLMLFVINVYLWFHTFWPGVFCGLILYRVLLEFETKAKLKAHAKTNDCCKHK